MKWIYVVGCMIAIASAQASAGFMDGQRLHSDLVQYLGGDPGFKDFASSGYVIGVADALDDIEFCIPAKTRQAQVFQVAANYLTAHPEQWQYDASSLLVEAFRNVWPCQVKK